MSVGLGKRIELEMRRRPADQIAVLNLDTCKANKIVEGFNSNFTNLHMLSLINSGLQTLEGFAKPSNLKKLDLSDNRISVGLDHLTDCTKLTHLSLSGNKIKNIDILDGLKDLHCLQSLDLFNCEVTNIDQYREKVFAKRSQISYLDGFDRDEQEEADDENDENDDGDEEDELSGEDDEEDSDDVDDDEDDVDSDDEDDEDDDGDSDDSESSNDESSSPRGTKWNSTNQQKMMMYHTLFTANDAGDYVAVDFDKEDGRHLIGRLYIGVNFDETARAQWLEMIQNARKQVACWHKLQS